MEFEIELEPHVGERMKDGVVQRVEFDQYQIFVTGEKLKELRGVERELIGYVGKKPGAPISYLKVALAFGPSVKVFNTLVRAGLIAKRREAVQRAKEARAEAERLKAEAEQLAADEKALALEESESEAARQLALDAIDEATKELVEAEQLAADEQSVERRVSEPLPVEQLQESARTATKPTPSIEQLAEEQNL